MLKNLLAPIAFLTVAAALNASTALRVDFAQLSRAADRIVAGSVVSIDSEEAADGLIYSTVTLEVERALPAGLDGSAYSFRMVGGEVGAKRLSISGFPQFAVGERIVLFLNGETSTVFGPTVGLWQGVFFVEEGVVLDSERRAVTEVRGERLLRGARVGKGSSVKAQGVYAVGVDAFLDAVAERRR